MFYETACQGAKRQSLASLSTSCWEPKADWMGQDPVQLTNWTTVHICTMAIRCPRHYVTLLTKELWKSLKPSSSLLCSCQWVHVYLQGGKWGCQNVGLCPVPTGAAQMEKFELHLTPSLEKKKKSMSHVLLVINLYAFSKVLSSCPVEIKSWYMEGGSTSMSTFECESVAGSLHSI